MAVKGTWLHNTVGSFLPGLWSLRTAVYPGRGSHAVTQSF